MLVYYTYVMFIIDTIIIISIIITSSSSSRSSSSSSIPRPVRDGLGGSGAGRHLGKAKWCTYVVAPAVCLFGGGGCTCPDQLHVGGSCLDQSRHVGVFLLLELFLFPFWGPPLFGDCNNCRRLLFCNRLLKFPILM